jgi:radical SAM protein with 4Fe4S-binding SPASM domain
VQLSAYGEPMMTPHIQGKFDDMQRFGVKCEMMTNATLMKGDALLERMSHIMGNLRVSIDGATAATYNRLRVLGDFNEVFANIRRYNHFRHLRPRAEQAPLHFSYILMRSTLDELPDFVRLVQRPRHGHRLGLAPGAVRGVDGVRAALRRPGLAQAHQRRAAAHRGGGARGRPEGRAAGALRRGGPPGPGAAPLPSPIRCYFLWQRMYVGPFGDVVPCCLAGIHANGNVRGSTFAEQWNNQLYQDMRRRVHSDNPHKPCATCYLVHRAPESAVFDYTDA